MPSCAGVAPESAEQGATREVTITGTNTNFTQLDSIASFCTGVTVNSITVTSSTEVIANITIAADAPLGACAVTVTTGAEIVTCTAAFTITAAPVTTTTSSVAPTTTTTTVAPTTTTTTPAGQVYEWNFTNEADYYVDGDWDHYGGMYVPVITALPGGGYAHVPARPYNPADPDDVLYVSDWASVFARINTNTQGDYLIVGDILGGGFTLTGMNNPTAVYGSLYLSPTGGSGSTVMINMSPMSRTGADGDYIYSFNLDTPADVKIKNGPGGTWGVAQYTGTFGGVIEWVNANASGNYAAFFGPQIGMSGTSETTFTVWQIQLTASSTTPGPTTTTTSIAPTTTIEVTMTIEPPTTTVEPTTTSVP